MLGKGGISIFKLNKGVKEEHHCQQQHQQQQKCSGHRHDADRRSFRKVLSSPNHKVDKHMVSSTDGKYRHSISKEEKPTGRKDVGGTVSRDGFQPEIHLGNRIIEDLTSKYRTELMNMQPCRKNVRKALEGVTAPGENRNLAARVGADADLTPRTSDVRHGTRKKAVSFLDDKLKSGFANDGFVLSPPSATEPEPETAPSTGPGTGGIINDGFVCSPAFETGPGRKATERPKPIISPTEEFLESLNEGYCEYLDHRGSDDDLNGIQNEGFIQSPPDSAAIEIEEKLLERDKSKSKLSGKKKRGFVNQMRKISNRKSLFNEKENLSKQKQKRHHSILNRRKKKDNGKAVEKGLGDSGLFNGSLDVSWEDEDVAASEEPSSGKKPKCRMESTSRSSSGCGDAGSDCDPALEPETPLSRHMQWKFSSMSKLPTRGRVNEIDESNEFHCHSEENIYLDERGMDFWVDGFIRINNKKKVDKINKINIHLHALFAAVENGHVEKARTILESSDVDVNSVNGDGFTPLDVAILTNHKSLAKILVAFGAQEGNHFQSPDKLESHLRNLSMEADRRVQELNGGCLLSSDQSLSSSLNNNRGSFSVVSHYPSSSSISCHGGSGDSEKELLIWERRSKGLKKMLLGYDQTRPPDMPFLVAVDVTGTNSVNVRYQGPEHQDSFICTKYKVQWSESENFDVLSGEKEITDVKRLECPILDLCKGKRYWFRVACGNLKGYGNYKVSTPTSVVPSSWRDVQGREPRFSGRLQQLEDLFADIKNLRPETASEIKDFSDPEKQGDAFAVPRRAQKKKTIKQLFTVAGKFQKHLKRGVYLVCLFYHDDKILVTNEDFLPAIEVDETYPSSINNDLHWFMKVACTWSDVKSLRQDMEKNLTSTTSHFRIKLLQAAQQMQSNLCTQDLGQLYYKPIRDAQGTLVFCSVNSLTSLKSISVLNLRWTPISKIQKKIVASEESNVGELLMASIQSQIAYHQVTNLKLSKGLYLGYLKMKSSVDLIQIIVPTKTPNVLPHCKIRNNPHVSSDEWEWLRRINSRHKSLENLQGQVKDIREADLLKGTEQQQMFVEQVAGTARKLFSYLDVSLDDAMLHRLYDVEVVDLNSDVSFLIIVPPVETSCSVPGQKDSLLERGDLMSISLQVFEMIHLGTYQPEVISRYSRLSCILELDLILAQHSHREAFSSFEVQTAKERLGRLQELQIQLNGVWKSVRWIMDLITFARDRSSSAGSLQLNSKSTGNLQNSASSKMGSIQTSSLSTGMSNCGVQTASGVPIKHLLALTRKKDGGSRKSPSRVTKSKCLKENHHYVKCEKRTLLQIPDSPKDPKILKSNVSRGSWPGPGVDTDGPILDASFSKSEQHLNVLGGGTDVGGVGCGQDVYETGRRKFSDSSSDCAANRENVPIDGRDASGRRNSKRDAMSDLGNRMPFSRSEDYLYLNQDLASSLTKHASDHHKSGRPRMTATSVSATNSPLLPQRNLCENNLSRLNAGSSLSIVNTNTSGSLHSVSSDESTAAVVSLPVTTPFRSGFAGTGGGSSSGSGCGGGGTIGSVQHSASLLSLAKPKIPVTVSLNSLTDVANAKRTSNSSGSGSILSGNIIPVNINQKPLKTNANIPDAALLNQHISTSLPSFPKHSVPGLPGGLVQLSTAAPGGGVQPGLQSPVKSPIKAVSPTDTVLSSGGVRVKRASATTIDPFAPSEIDFMGFPLDSGNSAFAAVGHKLLTTGAVPDVKSELVTSPVSVDVEHLDDEEYLENGVVVPALTSGVLQVYAAYDTGLAAGTSLKLHVTPRTSAREVVDLVVKQLNMAVLLKGKDGPIYPADKLKNFCLVAVIGARERCLRDDFRPLQLQNPWKKGRLYVRQKQDVLAALEHSSRQSAFL